MVGFALRSLTWHFGSNGRISGRKHRQGQQACQPVFGGIQQIGGREAQNILLGIVQHFQRGVQKVLASINGQTVTQRRSLHCRAGGCRVPRCQRLGILPGGTIALQAGGKNFYVENRS